MAEGFFIAGTDTGAGKTLVSCALLRAFSAQGLRAAGMKPVACGCDDAEKLRAAGNVNVPEEWTNPYFFTPAVAPHIAAHRAGVAIDLARIEGAYRQLAQAADVVIVEGVGGFLVPLGDRQDAAQLAQRLALPVILTVGMRLGCLSHALLTVEAMHSRGLKLAGWVANRIDPGMEAFEENVQTLREKLSAPLLGVIPFRPAEPPETFLGVRAGQPVRRHVPCVRLHRP